MRGWLQAAALAVAASLVVPAGVSGQSLGDAAAREKERRKGKAKTYSEDDLRRAGGTASGYETATPDESTATEGAPAEGTTPEGTAVDGATAEGGTKPEAGAPQGKSEDEQRAAQEKEWRERLKKSQDDVNFVIADIDKLQKSLGDVTGNYYSASRTNMMNRMDELKKKLATAQETLANVQEEGRRKGFRS